MKGDTFAFNQSLGSLPVSIDIWEMERMVEAIWRAQLFKMMIGIRSGLMASFTLLLFRKVSIASMIMKQVYETVNMFIIKSGQTCKITPLSTSKCANVYLSGLQPLQQGNFVHH